MSTYSFFDTNDLGITYLSPTLFAGYLPHPYKDVINPDMYLDFCLEDNEEQGIRAITNAFSNCKKAIHLRVDLILNQYGLLIPNIKCDFPTKLQILDDVALLPTTLLKNINSERNFLEHEYKLPDQERVNEAIDVAKLLYMASDGILSSTPIESIIGFDTAPYHRLMRLEPEKGKLEFYEINVLKDEAIKCYEEKNIEYLAEKLRFINGKITPFYQISDEPAYSIILNYANKTKWLFFINQLISVQRKDGNNIKGEISDGFISSVVRIPIDKKAVTSISAFIEQAISERLGRKLKLNYEC